MESTQRPRRVVLWGAFFLAGTALGAVVAWLAFSSTHGDGTAEAILGHPGESFAISGNVTQAMVPGSSIPLDLSFDNAHEFPMTVHELQVTVDRVQAPNATAALPCTVDDFSVDQVSPRLDIRVDAASTTSLAGLDIPADEWPQVGMLDAPNNQDGCKGATVTLAYTASGRLER